MVDSQNTTSLQQAKFLAHRALRAGQALERTMRPWLAEAGQRGQDPYQNALLLAAENAQRSFSKVACLELDQLRQEGQELRRQLELKQYSDDDYFRT